MATDLSDDHDELDPQVLADPLGPETTADDAEALVATRALVPAESKALAPADPFRRYMAEARRYPPLSREEEKTLARRYRETGDRDALFRLVTANLLMVARVALSFRRTAHNLLDLIQEGNLGLLAALERFDPELGVRLPTYAAWWVRAYMIKFLLDNVRLVRVGTTNARRKLLRNLRQEKARLEELGYEPDTKLLAEHFGVSEIDVTDVQAALDSHDVSIDAPSEEGSTPPEDLLPTADVGVEEQVARKELQEATEKALDRFRLGLSERNLCLLNERILSEDPLTLQQIGERFGTSREAVRQAEVRLMKQLEAHLRDTMGAEGSIQVNRES